MSNVTETPTPGANREATVLHESITARQLPAWTWVATLIISIAVAAGILSLVGVANFATIAVVGVVLFFFVHWVTSLAVEGSRPATERLARIVVTSFFLLALLPLGSLIYEVV